MTLVQERFPDATVLADSVGEQWLEEHDNLVSSFLETDNTNSRPENQFEGDDELTEIGRGGFSWIYTSDDIAIKVATRTTAIVDNRHRSPEDLLAQYNFMSALRKAVVDKPDTNIYVPRQHFIVVGDQRYIKGEEQIKGWISPMDFCKDQGVTSERTPEVYTAIRKELSRHLGLLGKVFLDLHASNILFSAEDGDLSTSSICLIDQPNFKHRFLYNLINNQPFLENIFLPYIANRHIQKSIGQQVLVKSVALA